MPIEITKNELISLLQGESLLDGANYFCSGLEFDSRQVRGGVLFVALKGEASHGHEFLERALEQGAAVALIEDSSVASSHRDRLVKAKDSLEAFLSLAAWWRNKLSTPIAGITGSVGKTTTKEMLAAILTEIGPGAYSQKSFNNHTGVPYTLCKLSPNDQWAVVEMGMNHVGELSRLTGAVRPDVACITRITAAHVGYFGTLEAIAQAKFEIAEGLPDGKGILVLNGDDSQLVDYVSKSLLHKSCKIVWAGSKTEHDAWLSEVEAKNLTGIRFRLRLAGEESIINMSIPGAHNAHNAALAALTAKSLLPGIPFESIVRGLERFSAPSMRLQVFTLADGRKIVDDSYNANPGSMTALLQLVKETSPNATLLLGDMLELGDLSDEEHRKLGEQVVAVKPGFVILVGTQSRLIGEVCEREKIPVAYAKNPLEAAKILRSEKFEVLFVKGSRGIGLDEAVRELVKG